MPLRQAWLLLPGVDVETRATLERELAVLLGDETEVVATDATGALTRATSHVPGWRRMPHG